jgi:hypothetical protein
MSLSRLLSLSKHGYEERDPCPWRILNSDLPPRCGSGIEAHLYIAVYRSIASDMPNPNWHLQDVLRCPHSFEANARQRYLQSLNLKLRDERKEKIVSVL